LIHTYVREAIEAAVREELAVALGAQGYERTRARVGHHNGVRERTLTGPTGPLELELPRAILNTPAGPTE
jgi:transposase-like protein